MTTSDFTVPILILKSAAKELKTHNIKTRFVVSEGRLYLREMPFSARFRLKDDTILLEILSGISSGYYNRSTAKFKRWIYKMPDYANPKHNPELLVNKIVKITLAIRDFDVQMDNLWRE